MSTKCKKEIMDLVKSVAKKGKYMCSVTETDSDSKTMEIRPQKVRELRYSNTDVLNFYKRLRKAELPKSLKGKIEFLLVRKKEMIGKERIVKKILITIKE